MLKQTLVILLVMLLANVATAASPRILLTNDDGYKAPGIRAVYKALTDAGYTVEMVAPATQQSGSSASITTHGITFSNPAPHIYAVEGRPADAVKIGVGYIMKDDPPDLVVSGANFGQNVGADTNLSGTVGAAITAQQMDIPAIAISVATSFTKAGVPQTMDAFPGAGAFLVRLLKAGGMPAAGEVLNVNYPALPALEIKGVRLAKLSNFSIATREYFKRDNGTYGPKLGVEPGEDPDSDAWLLSQGYITITPLDGYLGSPAGQATRSLVESLDHLPVPKAASAKP